MSAQYAKRPILLDVTNALTGVRKTSGKATSKKRRAPFSSPRKSKIAKVEIEDHPVIDFYALQLKSELKYLPNRKYMSQVQSDISHSMRSILVDWLIEVAFEYKLHSETLFLTVSYLDRFLSLVSLSRSKLQLLGVTCMFVASKYEEIDAPRLDEFVYICDNTYTKQEVLQMESLLLKTLEFRLTCSTAYTHLGRLLNHLDLEPDVAKEAKFLNEMFLQQCSCLEFRPSMVAVSAAFLAMCMNSPQAWPRCLSTLSRYSHLDAMPCIKQLLEMYQSADSSSLQAAVAKHTKLGCQSPTIRKITLQNLTDAWHAPTKPLLPVALNMEKI